MSTPPLNDSFTLYNLWVEISDKSGNIIGIQKIDDYFEVIGEDIFLPPDQGFSLYALSAILPLLPAKQRQNHPYDFMKTDEYIADPDFNWEAVYKISRIGTTTFRHTEVSGCSIQD